jgi:hypothetical protein
MGSVDVALDDVHASHRAQDLACLARSSEIMKSAAHKPSTSISYRVNFVRHQKTHNYFRALLGGVVATAHYQAMDDRGCYA